MISTWYLNYTLISNFIQKYDVSHSSMKKSQCLAVIISYFGTESSFTKNISYFHVLTDGLMNHLPGKRKTSSFEWTDIDTCNHWKDHIKYWPMRFRQIPICIIIIREYVGMGISFNIIYIYRLILWTLVKQKCHVFINVFCFSFQLY